jgi:predicted nicotinamide N-methyase
MDAAVRGRAPVGGDDVVEEVVAVGGRALRILRPRDADALLDEEAFEHEELLPYWAELWPSAVALARSVAGRALRGARTLELGCGLGVPSIAAGLAGGRVLATDWAPAAVAFTLENAQRNGASVEAAVCSWAAPQALAERAPWDLVLASDVLYERHNCPLLLALLPRLVGARGEVWLSDPGRPPTDGFLAAAAADGWRIASRPGEGHPSVRLHRLRRR